MKVKTIELFNKPLFVLTYTKSLIQMSTSVPDDEAGFLYVLQGNCINKSEIDYVSVTANQGVLAKRGNSIFKTLSYNGETEFRSVSIRFHKTILDKIYSESESPFFKKTNQLLTVNSVLVNPNELIAQYFKSLIQYFDYQELLTEELLILKLKEIISLLLQTENAPKVLEIMGDLFGEKSFEFEDIINAHIFSSITIEELALLTHKSLSSFKKEFKRVYNDTPKNYIINKRTEKVAELIQTSNDSISNIAHDCQFKTISHLSRVFKNRYGVSPLVFRKNFLDNK